MCMNGRKDPFLLSLMSYPDDIFDKWSALIIIILCSPCHLRIVGAKTVVILASMVPATFGDVKGGHICIIIVRNCFLVCSSTYTVEMSAIELIGMAVKRG